MSLSFPSPPPSVVQDGMTSRLHFSLGSSAILALAGLLGCGGNVTVGSGGGGAGGSGAGGGVTTGGGGSTTSSGGSVTTTTTTPTGTMLFCEGADHISCLQAYPSCVPVYDDQCCPTCDPMGGCADCIDIQFHHCASYGERCTGAPSVCGATPDWACAGGQADCNIDPGGSKNPCSSVAGCLPAYCSLNLENCPQEPECHPATKGTCSTLCDSVPPPCPDGTYAESDGFCYTGYCVPTNVCVIGL